MKKATMELSVNAIVILIIAIVILGLGLGFIRGMFGYVTDDMVDCVTNPEEDRCECDEWSCNSDGWCRRWKQDAGFICSEEYLLHIKEEYKQEVKEECKQEMEEYTNFCCKDCIKAHPKSKPIKINLEKEKCVEHTNETDECLVISLVVKSLKGDERNKFIFDRDCCIKKEKLNPCEQGNEDWVWDEEEWCSGGNIIFEEINRTDYKIIGCLELEIKKICRKKTIKDLTCLELEEYYTYHSAGIVSDCNTNNKDGFVSCANNQKYPWVKRSGEILFEYLKRCSKCS